MNRRGEVVAVNTFQRRDSQNLNFAISANDIAMAVDSAKKQTVVPLSPSSLPTRSKTNPVIPVVVDINGTLEADRILRQMQDVAIAVIPNRVDRSGNITTMLNRKSRLLLKTCGLNLVKSGTPNTPVLMLAVEFKFVRTTYYGAVRGAMFLVRKAETGQSGIVQFWEGAEHIGTFSSQQIESGVLKNSTALKSVERRIERLFRSISTSKTIAAGGNFPDEKAAASKLRLAVQFIQKGNTNSAKRWLREVIEEYPETSASRQAESRLVELASADDEKHASIALRNAKLRSVDAAEYPTRLRILIRQFPGTNAAMEAEELFAESTEQLKSFSNK